MKAHQYVYPRPKRIKLSGSRIAHLPDLALSGAKIPSWLRARLSRACRAAGVNLARQGAPLVLRLTDSRFAVADAAVRPQSYRLTLERDGSVRIDSPGDEGLRHGLVTLCLLLEARGGGAALHPLAITDAPAFGVRAVQADLAREFFPPASYLKRLIDRLVDLKINTLWLYLENNFRAPGLEDLAPEGSLTPAAAREVSDYGARRGVDVVPSTNLLSHMEGWFRLERHADLSDGPWRSYPLLHKKASFDLIRPFVDALIDAFPSKNFHANLDELLFTGTNPQAARAIDARSKALYFGKFAGKVVRYIRSRGKTVWMDDDMVLGKNIWRKEGFREQAPKALACIPKDTVMTHWYYQGPTRAHREAIERVRRSGRPFVVMPNSYSAKCDYTHLPALTENQAYMARAGRKNGAFGYACASWETHLGTSFDSTWPALAMSAEQGWSGGIDVDDDCLRRLSFVLTGETDGATGKFLKALSGVEELLSGDGVRQVASFRKVLVQEGPYWLWRRRSPVLGPRNRQRIRRLVAEAKRHCRRIGSRDVKLRAALQLPIVLFTEGLAILEAFDKAWAEYHRAAEIQRAPGRAGGQFRTLTARVVRHIRQAIAATGTFRKALRRLEATGQTPCDADGLARHEAALRDALTLLGQVIRRDMPLPYFERLFYLPDSYYISGLRQLARQNSFHRRHLDLPWPRRRS